MGKVGLISLFLLLNTYISPLYSANNPSVTFTKENDGTHTFLIDFKFFYHGNIDNALKKLTNFENLKDLNPTIKDSYVEKSSLDEYFVRSKFRDCVLFICRNISMLEKVTYSCSNSTRCKINSAVVSEDNNDIKSGKTSWDLFYLDNKTEITYSSKINIFIEAPDFLGEKFIVNSFISNLNYLSKAINQ